MNGGGLSGAQVIRAFLVRLLFFLSLFSFLFSCQITSINTNCVWGEEIVFVSLKKVIERKKNKNNVCILIPSIILFYESN